MNKINELINKLCPNGVEFKTLEKICGTITTGKLNANAMVENGEYPFFTCDSKPFKIDKYAFDEEAILISGNGSQVGHINYYKGKFNAYQRTYVIYNFKNVNVKYLLHYLKGYLKEYILKNCKKGSVPYITLPMLQNFKIQVPPIEIQNEIVCILDDLTLLSEELSSELSAELRARQKQYEYYSDKLLTLDKSVEKKELQEVCELVTGATPSTSKKEFWDNGDIPWMSSGEVNLKRVYETEKKITKLGYDNASTTLVPPHTVVIALAGQGKTRGKVAITEIELCTNQSLCSIICGDKINYKYLYYYLDSKYENLRAISNGDGTRGGLSLKLLKPYEISVPPMEEQEKIVNVLEKLDKLCNDISEGLSAEIEARKKQYEYYRDKLLTFKELKVLN